MVVMAEEEEGAMSRLFREPMECRFWQRCLVFLDREMEEGPMQWLGWRDWESLMKRVVGLERPLWDWEEVGGLLDWDRMEEGIPHVQLEVVVEEECEGRLLGNRKCFLVWLPWVELEGF